MELNSIFIQFFLRIYIKSTNKKRRYFIPLPYGKRTFNIRNKSHY